MELNPIIQSIFPVRWMGKFGSKQVPAVFGKEIFTVAIAKLLGIAQGINKSSLKTGIPTTPAMCWTTSKFTYLSNWQCKFCFVQYNLIDTHMFFALGEFHQR